MEGFDIMDHIGNEDLTNQEFAEYLKNMRTAAGLNQRQIARMMGVPLGTLQNYEAGVYKPRRDRLGPFIQKLRQVVRQEIQKKRRRAKYENLLSLRNGTNG